MMQWQPQQLACYPGQLSRCHAELLGLSHRLTDVEEPRYLSNRHAIPSGIPQKKGTAKAVGAPLYLEKVLKGAEGLRGAISHFTQ